MLQQPYRSLKETEARIGEIFRLKWDNIDFESRTIKITPKNLERQEAYSNTERVTENSDSFSSLAWFQGLRKRK